MSIKITLEGVNMLTLTQEVNALHHVLMPQNSEAVDLGDMDINAILDIVRDRLKADGMVVIVKAADQPELPLEGAADDTEPVKPKAKRGGKATAKDAEKAKETADADKDAETVAKGNGKDEAAPVPIEQAFDVLKELYHSGTPGQQKRVKALLGKYKVKSFSKIDPNRADELWKDCQKIQAAV